MKSKGRMESRDVANWAPNQGSEVGDNIKRDGEQRS